MATRSGLTPPKHIFHGRRGDGIPHTETQVVFTFTGQTIVKEDWTATAQIRQGPDSSEVIHTFPLVLEDSGDDVTLNADQLRVTIPRIPASVTSDLVGTKVGDLQLQKSGEEPTTYLDLEIQVTGDVTRV